MKRLLGSLLVLGLALLGPASSAFARGDGWEPVELEPFDAFICEANLHFETPVNMEYFRVVTIGGQLTLQITGNVTLTVTNLDNGKSITNANISGPGFIPLDETIEFSARGRNLTLLTPEQAEANGLPELFISSGYLDIVFNDDGTVTIKKLTGHVEDLCAELT